MFSCSDSVVGIPEAPEPVQLLVMGAAFFLAALSSDIDGSSRQQTKQRQKRRPGRRLLRGMEATPGSMPYLKMSRTRKRKSLRSQTRSGCKRTRQEIPDSFALRFSSWIPNADWTVQRYACMMWHPVGEFNDAKCLELKQCVWYDVKCRGHLICGGSRSNGVQVCAVLCGRVLVVVCERDGEFASACARSGGRRAGERTGRHERARGYGWAVAAAVARALSLSLSCSIIYVCIYRCTHTSTHLYTFM